jgi:hypothetical protein
MPISPEERAAINRANAAHSTGPKTPQGKRNASRNSYKHGLAAATAESLPPEDREFLRQLTDEWLDSYRPQTPGKRALLDRAVFATVQFHRNVKIQAAEIARQVNDAEVRWEREQEEAVADLAILFTEDPATAVRELKRSAAGCRWLLGRWGDLAEVLDRDGCLHAPTHRDLMVGLLGFAPDDLGDESVYWFHLANLAAQPNPRPELVAWYLDPQRIPDTMRRPLAQMGGLPSHREAKAELRGALDNHREMLSDRERCLRVTVEEPERSGARARAMLLEGEKGACWLRYEKMHDSMFHRAYKGLMSRGERDYFEGEDLAEVSAIVDPGGARNEANALAPNEANAGATEGSSCLSPCEGGPGWGVAEPALSSGSEGIAPSPHPNPPPQGGREQDPHDAPNEANPDPDSAPNEANPERPRMIGSIVVKPPTTDRRLVDVILDVAAKDPGGGPVW